MLSIDNPIIDSTSYDIGVKHLGDHRYSDGLKTQEIKLLNNRIYFMNKNENPNPEQFLNFKFTNAEIQKFSEPLLYVGTLLQGQLLSNYYQ